MPFLASLALFPSLSKARHTHAQYTKDKAQRRLDMGADRRDFMSYILRYNHDKGMTRAETTKTSGTLIIGGSETSATLLSDATFHLLKNPNKMRTLTEELHSTFSTSANMSIIELARLPYLNACLREAFRMYPPVPGVLPQCTQPGRAVIAGYFVPEDVSVGVHGWSTYRSSRNFKDLDEFVPERWLGDAKYEKNNKSALQPFSMGPRNCLGKHLAWAEIRGILARVLWDFGLELCAESDRWDEQKVFILWDKLPLMVQLKARGL